jgi:3-dehydroquinate dehydratase II
MTSAEPNYILSGLDLDRLGRREPDINGKVTLAEIEARCRKKRSRKSGHRVSTDEP